MIDGLTVIIVMGLCGRYDYGAFFYGGITLRGILMMVGSDDTVDLLRLGRL